MPSLLLWRILQRVFGEETEICAPNCIVRFTDLADLQGVLLDAFLFLTNVNKRKKSAWVPKQHSGIIAHINSTGIRIWTKVRKSDLRFSPMTILTDDNFRFSSLIKKTFVKAVSKGMLQSFVMPWSCCHCAVVVGPTVRSKV